MFSAQVVVTMLQKNWFMLLSGIYQVMDEVWRVFKMLELFLAVLSATLTFLLCSSNLQLLF